MDWEKYFDRIYEKPDGITEQQELDFISNWNLPLTEEEIKEIMLNSNNGDFFADEEFKDLYKPIYERLYKKDYEYLKNIKFPQTGFPNLFIKLMRYSDGLCGIKGSRIYKFINSNEIRHCSLTYKFYNYMPDALPFATDASGSFYVFDMRELLDNCDYPVYITNESHIGWNKDDAIKLADNFEHMLTQTSAIVSLIY